MLIKMKSYYKHGYTRLHCCSGRPVVHRYEGLTMRGGIVTMRFNCFSCRGETKRSMPEERYFKFHDTAEKMEALDEGKK